MVKKPLFGQVNVLAVIAQLVLMAAFALLFYQFDQQNFFMFAVLTIFALSWILKYAIPRHHRKGMAFFQQGKLQEAIDCFEQSYDFFRRYHWLDKYRFFFMLSSTRVSYTELALVNKAFCLSRVGWKEEAVKTYQKALEEFPQSDMAKAGLQSLG